jgi:hypothetical protein
MSEKQISPPACSTFCTAGDQIVAGVILAERIEALRRPARVGTVVGNLARRRQGVLEHP